MKAYIWKAFQLAERTFATTTTVFLTSLQFCRVIVQNKSFKRSTYRNLSVKDLYTRKYTSQTNPSVIRDTAGLLFVLSRTFQTMEAPWNFLCLGNVHLTTLSAFINIAQLDHSVKFEAHLFWIMLFKFFFKIHMEYIVSWNPL